MGGLYALIILYTGIGFIGVYLISIKENNNSIKKIVIIKIKKKFLKKKKFGLKKK